MKNAYLTLTLIFSLFSALQLSAQLTVWTGNGDQTSWHDPANWSTNSIPNEDIGAFFPQGTAATVTGYTDSFTASIIIDTLAEVTLDLDFSVGGEYQDDRGIIIRQGAKLTIGQGFEERLCSTTNEGAGAGIIISGAGAELIVTNNAYFFITSSTNGMTITEEAKLTNYGSIMVADTQNNGIELLSGQIDNYGELSSFTHGSLAENTGDGLIVAENASITNHPNSSLSVGGSGRYSVRLAGTLTNAGTFDVSLPDEATANNIGLLLGDNTATGNFQNLATGVTNIEGGEGMAAVNLYLSTGSELINTGTMHLSGGQADSSLVNRGMLVNEICATINFARVRLLNRGGTLINNGLLQYDWIGSLIINLEGTVTNHGFYGYFDTNEPFAVGDGTINQQGLEARDTVDLLGMCATDTLGLTAPHTWYADAANTSEVGQNNAEGQLVLQDDAFLLPSVQNLYTCYGDEVLLTLLNVDGDCIDEGVAAEYLLTEAIFQLAPNPANAAVYLTFSPEFAGMEKIITLSDLNGRPLWHARNRNQTGHSIELDRFASGVYFLTIQTMAYVQTQKIIVAH